MQYIYSCCVRVVLQAIEGRKASTTPRLISDGLLTAAITVLTFSKWSSATCHLQPFFFHVAQSFMLLNLLITCHFEILNFYHVRLWH